MSDQFNFIGILIFIHVIAATVSLGTMFVPMVTKKGVRIHRRFGRIYVYSMAIACSSATIISLWRIFGDPKPSQQKTVTGLFLIFLSAFAMSGISYGLSALRNKKRKQAVLTVKVLGPPIFVVLFGIVAMIGGKLSGSTLLFWFPIVGMIVAVLQIKYWLKSPQEKMHWWYAHMSGMFTACIGTTTAFVVVALPKLVDASWTQSLWVWLTPSLVLVPMLIVLTSRYRKKFEIQ